MFVALQSVGIEGRSYWFIAASPLGPKSLLGGKWVASLLLGVTGAVICSLGVAALTTSFYLPGIILGILAGFMGAAVSGLYGVGISAMFARFDWDNPNRATSQAGQFLLMVCLAGLGILGAIAVAIGFALSTFLPLWACVALAAVLWAAVGAAPGYALAVSGAGSLGRMEWEL